MKQHRHARSALTRVHHRLTALVRRVVPGAGLHERGLRHKLEASIRETAELRHRLDQATALARDRKRQARLADARVAEGRTGLRRKISLVAAQVPSEEILADALALRVASPPFLAAERRDAGERHAAWLDASPAYRDAWQQATQPATRPAADMQQVPMHGINWHVPADADGRSAARLVRQGVPLKDILQAREFAVGGVMIDVGANVGLTSISRVLLGDVRVAYAAEPDPANYAALVRTVAAHGLAGFVIPDRAALGARTGPVLLKPSESFAGHRVLPAGAAAISSRPACAIEVEAFTLDAWLVRMRVEPQSVTFIKVDAQGSEPWILAGAGALLARGGVAWQLEVDPVLLTAAGSSLEGLFDQVEQHFSFFVDVGTAVPGPRRQPVSMLRERLDYLGERKSKTDIIVYRTCQ